MERSVQQRQLTVLVIGDIICDVYLVGTLDRPLAGQVSKGNGPAPVFCTTAQYSVLGGAANVACEAKALGCDVRLVGVIGADAVGRRTREMLRQKSIVDTLVLEDAGRPTAQRTYLSIDEGRILCVDRRQDLAPSRSLCLRLLECADAVLSCVDGVLCADDDAGLGDGGLRACLLSAAKAAGCPVFVGTPARWSRYTGSNMRSSNGSVGLTDIVRELSILHPGSVSK